MRLMRGRPGDGYPVLLIGSHVLGVDEFILGGLKGVIIQVEGAGPLH